MEMQELEITIEKDGRIGVKARGMHGTACLALTKNIEDAAGVVEQREYLPEYYEQTGELQEHRRAGLR